MTSVRVVFVLIFPVVQLYTAECVVYGPKMTFTQLTVKGRSIETRMINLQNWLHPIVHQCVTYGTLLILVRRDRGTFFRLRILVSGGIVFIGFEMSNWGIAKGVNLCFATNLYTQQYFSVKNSWRYWVKLCSAFCSEMSCMEIAGLFLLETLSFELQVRFSVRKLLAWGLHSVLSCQHVSECSFAFPVWILVVV